jgi:hypothetical protein
MNAANPCFAYDGSCDQGYNNSTGELGHMFYRNLGNLGISDASGNSPQEGYGLLNTSFTDAGGSGTVSFQNLQSFVDLQTFLYWYGEEYAPDTNLAWAFRNRDGSQGRNTKGNYNYAWAVRTGDVAEVPIPAAGWLLGAALLGLIGLKRRHR